MSVTPLNLLLVDDHRIVAEGMQQLLEARGPYRVTHLATSVQQALSLLRTQQFDVVVTDYSLPDGTGLEVLQQAKASPSELPVVVLSMHDEPELIQDLLTAGADGFVLKSEAHSQLLLALEQVVQGNHYLSPEVASVLVQGMRKVPIEVPLTKRETEVLKLVVQELTSKEIAAALCISELTVETHRKNIMRKTGSKNLVGLVKYAYAHGFLREP